MAPHEHMRSNPPRGVCHGGGALNVRRTRCCHLRGGLLWALRLPIWKIPAYNAGKRCKLKRLNGEDATIEPSGSSPNLQIAPTLSGLKLSHSRWLPTGGNMQSSSTKVWVVRAGRNSVYVEYFLEKRVVAIGWGEVGEIESTLPDVEIRRRFDEKWPSEKPRTRATWAAQVKRFLREVEEGDTVVTYDGGARLYHIGIVRSPAALDARVVDDQERQEFVRNVEWTDTCPRDNLSASTRNSLGSLATFFRVSTEAAVELQRSLSEEGAASLSDEGLSPISEQLDAVDILQEYISQSEQLVEDKIASLDWQQLQELVSGIMRGMGYRTRVSNLGSDRGVDVFASPDGLGLVEPRIFVEVKHRVGPVGAPLIRAFLGGRQQGDRCLYVSTGGFTKEARYEAARSSFPLTLVAMVELRELLVDYYETLDSESRSLVPLRKVFLPVSE